MYYTAEEHRWQAPFATNTLTQVPRYLNQPNTKAGKTPSTSSIESAEGCADNVFGRGEAKFMRLVLSYMKTTEKNQDARHFYESRWFTVGKPLREWAELRGQSLGAERTLKRYVAKLRAMGVLFAHKFYRERGDGRYSNQKYSYSLDFARIKSLVIEANGGRPLKSVMVPKPGADQVDFDAYLTGNSPILSWCQVGPMIPIAFELKAMKVQASPSLTSTPLGCLENKPIHSGRPSPETASAGTQVGLVWKANGTGAQVRARAVSLKSTAGALGGITPSRVPAPRRKESPVPLDHRTPAQRRAEKSADVSSGSSKTGWGNRGGFSGQSNPAAPRKNDYSASRPSGLELARQTLEQADSRSDPTSLLEAISFISPLTQASLVQQGVISVWRAAPDEVWEPGLVGFHDKATKLITGGMARGTAYIQLINDAIKFGRSAVRVEAASAPRRFHPSGVVLDLDTPSVEYEHNGKLGYRAIVFYADENHLVQTTIAFGLSPITPLTAMTALEAIPALNGELLPLKAASDTYLADARNTFQNLK